MGNPRQRDRIFLQELDQVTGGGFSFHVCGEGKNDFAGLFLLDPIDQCGNAQILWRNSIEWRNAPA